MSFVQFLVTRCFIINYTTFRHKHVNDWQILPLNRSHAKWIVVPLLNNLNNDLFARSKDFHGQTTVHFGTPQIHVSLPGKSYKTVNWIEFQFIIIPEIQPHLYFIVAQSLYSLPSNRSSGFHPVTFIFPFKIPYNVIYKVVMFLFSFFYIIIGSFEFWSFQIHIYICKCVINLPTEHQGVHKSSFRDDCALQDRIRFPFV